MEITEEKARELMKLAIEKMKLSIQEPRPNGEVSPKVGAVILLKDGKVETAYRGERRLGDHAEYTLFERKLRDVSLDDAILFTTLEPCAPGARDNKYEKQPCSERIVNARIKEVYIGIGDPDPKVDREGINHLLANNITVKMFPRDLQEIIEKENEAFLTEAKQRNKDGVKQPQNLRVSILKNIPAGVGYQDLSRDALEKFRIKAKIDNDIDSPEFKHILITTGLLADNEKPTGYGILLFGKNPRNSIPCAALKGTIHLPDGREENREFDSPLIQIPDQLETWLRDKAPISLDRSSMESVELLGNIPLTLIREAVINALVHRNYDIDGAKCYIDVTQHMVTVKSPGKPQPPITFEQLQDLTASSLSTNPIIAYVFKQMGFAEEKANGLKSFREVNEKYHLPRPTYKYEDPYLELTVYLSPESSVELLPQHIRGSFNGDEAKGWQLIATKTLFTSSDYMSLTGFNYQKAIRHLNKFVDLNLLHRIGAGPSTKYEVVR